MSGEAEPLALVVGGGSGIGAALVAAHRAEATRTVVWDIVGERDMTCDVADPEAVGEAVAKTRSDWGVPDRVTVTAGVGHAGLLTDVPVEEFDRIMAVNARGPWLCLRAWARVMEAEGRTGSFVTVSSISARLADRSMGVYCMSKAALSMFVKVAAQEWGPLNLRVNAVAPGATRTPMLGPVESSSRGRSPWLAAVASRTALGRLGEAEDVAQVILGLHGMAWVTGQVLECDGGLSLHSPINPAGRGRGG